jgi:hypothetical protein
MNACFSQNKTFLQSQQIICSGSIGGDMRSYLAFLREFTDNPRWRVCDERGHDQPVVNALIRFGAIDDLSIPYDMKGCCDGFATMAYCSQIVQPMVKDQMLVGCDGTPLPYVHQYNRFPRLKRFFYGLVNISLH